MLEIKQGEHVIMKQIKILGMKNIITEINLMDEWIEEQKG